MPRGQPDYGLYTATPAASGIADPGEAAARLGSINVYDRRGWTVWMDDFEAPLLKWLTTSGGVGVNPILSVANSWTGIQSAYFFVPAGVGNSILTRLFPLLRLGKLGVEFWVNGEPAAGTFLECRVDIYDGTNHTRGELHINYGAVNNVSINTPGGWQIIDTTFYNFFNRKYEPVKMVLDMDSDTFVRLLVGSTEYDISAYHMIPVGAVAVRYIVVRFWFGDGDALLDTELYLDNFILTQQEP